MGFSKVFAVGFIVVVLILASIISTHGQATDDCQENCDCSVTTVACVRGKVPAEGFGSFFDVLKVTEMHINNSEAETSLTDKTRLDPLTSTILTYENLVTLSLKGVYIKTINDDAFGLLSSLTHLYLDDNLIDTLTSKTFSGLRQLQTLSLNNNKLKTVPGGSFESLISIVNLHLSDNEIDTIQAGAFPKDPLIEYLDISRNRDLRTIPTSVDSLRNLDKLIARDCKINELREKWADKFPGLIEVDLTNNLIPELKQTHFMGLAQLKKLFLGQNKITSLGSTLFGGSIMTDVNISHNEIVSIHSEAILSAQITNLDLSHNPVGSGVWNQGIFDHADIRWEIRKLYLANVNLEAIGELFRGIKRLNVLDLSGNQLTTVSKQELEDFAPNLEQLVLDNNRLTNIVGAFDDMKQLERLSLAGNKLKLKDEEGKVTFPETLMDDLDQLENLDISNNSFTYIPDRLATAFRRKNHLKIGLAQNPYYCDYRTKPLHEYLLLPTQGSRCPSQIREGVKYDDQSEIPSTCLRCAAPPKLVGTYLIQLTSQNMKPPPPEPEDPLGTGGIVAILVGLILLLVIIAIVLIILKRKQEKRRQQEDAPVPQYEDGDWDPQADYDDFDESRSTFSTAAKSVAYESAA